MPKPEPLATRIAVVTGAGSGIGRAIAQRLAAEGACVVVADVNEESARQVADELGGPDVGVAERADVTDADAVAGMIREAVLAFGGVDLVVDNTGLSVSKPLPETGVKDRYLQHDVMARGSFPVSREAARAMIAQGMGGDIVYIASKNSLFAGPHNVALAGAPRCTGDAARSDGYDRGRWRPGLRRTSPASRRPRTERVSVVHSMIWRHGGGESNGAQGRGQA